MGTKKAYYKSHKEKTYSFGIDTEKNQFLGSTWGGWPMQMRT